MDKPFGRSISVTDPSSLPPRDGSPAPSKLGAAAPVAAGFRKTRQMTTQSFKVRPTLAASLDHSSRKVTQRTKKNPTLSIQNFDFSSLPKVKILELENIKRIIVAAGNIEEGSSQILEAAEYRDGLDAFYRELLTLADCNLRLETPLILSILEKNLTLTVLLLCRPQAELDFCSISNDSARKLIFDGYDQFHYDIQDLLAGNEYLAKFEEIQYHFGNHKPTGFEIRIDSNKFRIKRKVSEHLSQK